jgi:hypothetical protein
MAEQHGDAIPNSLRMACLDLSRITEEIAILSHAIIGICSGKDTQPRRVRKHLCNAFFNCLDATVSAPYRVAIIDPLWSTCSERIDDKKHVMTMRKAFGKSIKKFLNGRVLGRGHKLLQKRPLNFQPIDLVVKPISGLPELTRGKFGAMTIVAGAVKNSFKSIDQDPRSDALHANDKLAIDGLQRDLTICAQDPDVLADFEKNLAGMLLEEPIGDSELLKKAVQNLCDSANLATMSDEPNLDLLKLMGGKRHLELSGAPDGAAIVAMSQKHFGINSFISITRRTTTYLIALAARALESNMIALPLKVQPVVVPDKQKKRGGFAFSYVLSNHKVMRPSDFVDTENVFLVATGITPHPLLKGVEFEKNPGVDKIKKKSDEQLLLSFPNQTAVQATHDDSPKKQESPVIVQTQSIILNGASKTVRYIRHTRDLRKDHFYSINAKDKRNLVTAFDVYKDFLEKVSKPRRRK